MNEPIDLSGGTTTMAEVAKVVRGPLTRLKRLRLALWHARCALVHLWRAIRP